MVGFWMNVEGRANRIDYGSDIRCERKVKVGNTFRVLTQTVGR